MFFNIEVSITHGWPGLESRGLFVCTLPCLFKSVFNNMAIFCDLMLIVFKC